MNNKVPEHPSKNRNIGEFNPLVVVAGLLVMLYTTANIMAVKVISIGGISLFDAGTVTFPLAYMLSDVLAEIWGYKTSKKVIYLTFVCNFLMIVFLSLGIYLPFPDYMADTQNAYKAIFTYVPRIVAASLIAFLSGELVNAKVLVKMKERSKDGRHLWMRTIFSSVVGYIFDTVIFVIIAFAGTVPMKDMVSMVVAQYFMKTVIEAVLGTPLAYALIHYLRRNYAGLEEIQ